jgi:hypothetical protein
MRPIGTGSQLARSPFERLQVEDARPAAQQLDRPALLLVAEDLVDGRAGRAGELCQRLLGERDQRPPVFARVERRQSTRRPRTRFSTGR